jgi:hypothetical protein
MIVKQRSDSHRLYQVRLGIIHVTITILQNKGVHIQAALGSDPTYTLPGFELTAGLTAWNQKDRHQA